MLEESSVPDDLERLCYEAAQAGETWSSLARRQELRRDRVRNLAAPRHRDRIPPAPTTHLGAKAPPKPRRLIKQHLAGERQELAQLNREWRLGRTTAPPHSSRPASRRWSDSRQNSTQNRYFVMRDLLFSDHKLYCLNLSNIGTSVGHKST